MVTLDGDLQNDPADIAKLLEKMKEGYEIVCGWRSNRKDPFFSRKLPSLIVNGLIRAWRRPEHGSFRRMDQCRCFLGLGPSRFNSSRSSVPPAWSWVDSDCWQQSRGDYPAATAGLVLGLVSLGLNLWGFLTVVVGMNYEIGRHPKYLIRQTHD